MPSATPAARAPTSSSRSRSRPCTCCDWWIAWVTDPALEAPRDDLARARARHGRLVLGDRGGEVRGALEILREGGDEQVLEDAQLARRRRPDAAVGAREGIPRPGEGDEARAAAV